MHYKVREVRQSWDWVLLLFMLVVSAGVIGLTYQLPDKTIFILIVITMTGLTGYIYYAIRAVRNLTYEVDRKGITINYGFKTLLIPYEDILSIEVKPRAGLSRLAGNDWPGSYSGYFTERGEQRMAVVYATELKDLIKIQTRELNYFISPQNNERFMEKVRQDWTPPRVSETALQQARRPHLWQTGPGLALLALNLIALGLAAAYIYHLSQTVEQLPLHYNYRGEVDRYGSPAELYFTLVTSVIILPIIVFISDMMTRRGVPSREAARLLWIPLSLTAFMAVLILSLV